MTVRTSRTTRRVPRSGRSTVVGLVAAIGAAALVAGLAVPAGAATPSPKPGPAMGLKMGPAKTWTRLVSIHGGKVEGCVAQTGAGATPWKVVLRGNNTKSSHTHLFGATVYAAGDDPVDRWKTRARAGKLTTTTRLVISSTGRLSVGMGEVTGEGLGGDVDLARIGSCTSAVLG